MLLSHSQKDIDLQENWPIRFYESRDPLARLAALEARLSESPNNTEEHMRREVLLQRFPELKNGKQPERDGFIAAWMMLLIVGRSGVNFLNRKKLKKDIETQLNALGILNCSTDPALLTREWESFASLWIETCVQDRTYTSTAFGMFHLKDDRLAGKIAAEIDEATRLIPAKFGYEAECAAFRAVVVRSFEQRIENGGYYWQRYMSAQE